MESKSDYFYSYCASNDSNCDELDIKLGEGYIRTVNGKIERLKQNILIITPDVLARIFVERIKKMNSPIDINNYIKHHYIKYQGKKEDFIVNTIHYIKTAQKQLISDKEFHEKNGSIFERYAGVDISNEMQRLETAKECLENIGVVNENAKGNKAAKKQLKYRWGATSSELEVLFQQMKGLFIDKETTLNNFKAAFSEFSTNDYKPVKWKASNRLFAYFLSRCYEGQDWQGIAENGKLFINKNDKALNRNDLSVAFNEITKFGNPTGFEKIDSVLGEIKNLKNIKTS